MVGNKLFSCVYLLVPISVLGLGKFSYNDDDSRGPDDWRKVKDYKDNYWQNFHLLEVNKNECKDKKGQSPVNLEMTTSCKGDHHMLYKHGTCKIEDVDFRIEPWGLEGHYPFHGQGCDAPNLDISNSFHRRAAARFDLKVPSEHAINGRRYDAEFYIAHIENTAEESKGNRENLVAMTSVLFDASENKKNDWLEKLIEGWEEVAERENLRCSGAYDSNPFEAVNPTLLNRIDYTSTSTRYKGCYSDQKADRMFSHEAKNRGASIEECALLCMEYKYFALQSKGQCFCGDHEDYSRHGSSDDCKCESNNVGSYVACVYDSSTEVPTPPPTPPPTPTPTPPPFETSVSSPSSYKFIGCYRDKKGSRMFSKEAKSRKTSITECAELCEGYKYFSRQYKGQCFCGNNNDFDKHGLSSGCNCDASNVGSYKACVYDTDGETRKKRRLRRKDWHIYAPFRKQYYYGYEGSLTMPPCSDSVYWYVMTNTQSISLLQLQRLQVLITGYRDESCSLGTYADKSGGVARPLQNSKGQKIFQCTSEDYA